MRLPIAILLVLAVPLAAAQDPDVNESEMDAEAPPADDAYLYEDDAADPTLDESDMNTSVPPADESWLTADDAAVSNGDGAATETARDASGPALVLVLAALAALAVAVRR